jgi:CheY-like chemotaxis protein
MTDASAQGAGTVFFLGSDAVLFEDLQVRLAERGVDLRGFRTVAGMMVAADHWSAPVLVLDLAVLPPGRDPHGLADRLEETNGVRPLLVLLGAPGAPIRRAPAQEGISAAFPSPYDGGLIATTLIELAGTRTPTGRRVLIVGDSPVEEGNIATVLRRAGIRSESVSSEGDLDASIDRVAPAAILVDLDTLAVGGRELVRRIRDHGGCESLPLIFLSAEGVLEDRDGALHIGGDDYLVKPVQPEALVATVERRLAGSRPSSEPVGPGLALLDWNPFLRRLDQAMHDEGTPGTGQAVLYIRTDGADSPAGEHPWRRLAEAEVRRATTHLDRGAWSREGALVLWVRRDSDSAVAALAEELRLGLAGLDTALARGGAWPSCSIGVAPFLPPADTAQTLVSRAQAAQGQARGLGGSRVMAHICMVEPTLAEVDDGEEAIDATLLPLLHRALAGQGFQLVYQPILPLRQSGRERYEALLRLRTPTGAIIPPLAFLPAAERHGLLPDLDRWVLTRALEVLRHERDAGNRVRLLIHQTSQSLASPEWLDWVRGEILRLDLIKHRPVLEFSAASILANEGAARVLFPSLEKLGIEV